jgi:hypothetical protein
MSNPASSAATRAAILFTNPRRFKESGEFLREEGTRYLVSLMALSRASDPRRTSVGEGLGRNLAM